jgi:hypothetical protein
MDVSEKCCLPSSGFIYPEDAGSRSLLMASIYKITRLQITKDHNLKKLSGDF